MDEIIYLTSTKTQLIYKGCKYQRKDKNGDGSWYYSCVRENCGMSLTAANDRIIREPKEHNHWPLFKVQIDIELELNKLKDEICNNTNMNIETAYHNVYRYLLSKYSLDELNEYWQDWKNAKSTFYYHRQKNRPTLPRNNQAIILTPEYSQQLDQPFLRFNNTADNGNGMLIFMSNEGAEVLRKSSIWHLDGTFKTAPLQFYQIFTIHGYYGSNLLPGAYALLKKKDRETYDIVLQKIKNILLENKSTLNVKLAITDFEKALQQSITAIFNNQIQLKGCWFHYNQAVIRKLFNLGFKIKYVNDQNFRLWCRRFSALALIPLNKIDDAWNIILDKIPCQISKELIKFIVYFSKTWLTCDHGSNCNASIWNHYETEADRTNNGVEGRHSNMIHKLKAHPDIFTTIKYFQQSDLTMSSTYTKMKQGNNRVQQQSNADKVKEQQLATIQEEYKRSFITFEDYFDKLSYHVAHPYEILEYNTTADTTDNNNNDDDSDANDDNDSDSLIDQLFDENDNDEINVVTDTANKKRPKKVVLENPFKQCKFLTRIDLKNLTIKPKHDNDNSTTTQPQPTTSADSIIDSISTTVTTSNQNAKSIFKSNKKAKTKDNETTANNNKENEPTTSATSSRESRYNKRTAIKQEKTDEPEFLVAHDVGFNHNQRKRLRSTELIVKNKEWLGVIHIDEMQSMIHSKYPQLGGLFHTNRFLDSNHQNTYLNPNTIHDTPFIQIMHAEEHWVTLTNYNPFYENSRYGLGVWFIYDSLNNVENILHAIKPALKRLNIESNHITLMNCLVHQQHDIYDCGLFAIGYAIAIAEDKDPSKLVFNQARMRGEFNTMMQNGSFQQFSHFDIVRETTYREIAVDLSDVQFLMN